MSIAINTANLPTMEDREAYKKYIEQKERMEKAAGIEPADTKTGTASFDKSSEPDVDVYIPEQMPDPAGKYEPVINEDGERGIAFDDPGRIHMEGPLKERNPESPEHVPNRKEGEKEGEERCTVSTERVDAEIRKLKQRAADLEQQIARAADDPDKQEKLQRQLTQVENQIQRKDSDSYRRQNAEYRYG